MSMTAAGILAELEARLPPHYVMPALEKIRAKLAGDEESEDPFEKYARIPVGVKKFIEGEDFLNKKKEVYPAVMDELIELNSGGYDEAVLTGGIGTAKTTIALYTTAYQLYLLSCMKNPHGEFGLDPSSEIMIIFQSINANLAKSVDYTRFRHMIEQSHYFNTTFPFDKDLASKMIFPNRIEVVPVSGEETAAIGQNVIGGVIDEVNYMAVVEKSKASFNGGVYDQAIAVYNSIARRRESRFMIKGELPGMLCLVSSKRYPGQFTDMKEEEARTNPRIFLYDKRAWEIKPEGSYTGEWFHMFIGDEARKPLILEEGETVVPDDRHLVMPIPLEHKPSFETDPMNALREIAGVATLARFPFIIDTGKIGEAFGKVQSIASRPDTDFSASTILLYPKRIIKPEAFRWAHIDLGLTSDSAGVAVGRLSRFMTMERGDMNEILPEIIMDLTLEVMPPKGGEILFYKIRQLLAKLKELGMNIRWVSFDSFQSADSMQLLRQQGFATGKVSMDTTPLPYELTKASLVDGRLLIPDHPKLAKEFATLEKDPKTGKIDHPPKGSKDIADAVAGVVYGLTMRRELWAMAGIPPNDIPESVMGRFLESDKQISEAESA